MNELINLKKQLDEIDIRIANDVVDGFTQSRIKILIGMWEKGKEVYDYRGVNSYSYRDLEKQTARDKNSLKCWNDLYKKNKNKEKYVKEHAEPRAKLWANRVLNRDQKLLQEENKISEPLPEGQFEVIVIDPPWKYGTEYDSNTRRVASPYPEMEISELMKIKLPSADNCVLFLWSTHKFIWEAKKIMNEWGFEYKLILVWDKEKLGMGAWLRCQCEFCLLGIKGKPQWNLTNERDIIREARREHSRKPDGFYKMIEKMLPNAKKIDIFGREKRGGWEIYGNESEKFE